MSKPIIAFQGIPGAYSHLACLEARPDHEPLPCPSFEDAFAAVEEEKATLAMIPIDNSLGGRVADIHHLLPESNLFIVDEHFQSVKHHLLGVKGARLADIKCVYSHTQALSQCRKRIRAHGFERHVSSDTAGAAHNVAQHGDKSAAAIASKLAGEIYELDVLEAPFEDEIGNTTRFVIMSREHRMPAFNHDPVMTSIIFQVRSVPAALYKSLGGFATNGINITKLESYMIDANFTVAQFYAEFEGHPEDQRVQFALEELDFFSKSRKVLGTYLKDAFRQ